MAKPYRQAKNPWFLLLLLLAGGLAGNVVAYFLPASWRVLKPVSTIGLKPATLDIHFLQLTFGFTVEVGILTLVGFLFGYLLYRKI